jgi:hypothetical protein
MKAITVVAIAVVAAILVRQLWPKEVEVIVPGPPVRPDTVYVDSIRVDTLVETRTVFSTDTVNLVQTVVLADTVRIACGVTIPGRTYVSQVEVGEVLGDSTWIFGEKFSADSAGMNFQPYAQSVWTAGLLRGILAEGDSVRVDFDDFPRPKECSFFDKAEFFLMGTGTGILIKTVF